MCDPTESTVSQTWLFIDVCLSTFSHPRKELFCVSCTSCLFCFFLSCGGNWTMFENNHSLIIHFNGLDSLYFVSNAEALWYFEKVCKCVQACTHTVCVCASGLVSITRDQLSETGVDSRSTGLTLTASFWKSFDICAVFVLPVWQPGASKPPF